MTHTNIKSHWEHVYETKQPDQLSWTQLVPETSLAFIEALQLSKEAKIIDIGGGDSRLVDELLVRGYKNVTVLDISANALKKAQVRLGSDSGRANWIVQDVTAFEPDTLFDLWHDRATFHFLTGDEQVARYLNTVQKSVAGYLTIGTFSNNGPARCSGLAIRQYSEVSLEQQFSKSFDKMHCVTEDHITPFHTRQNFVFCSFKRKQNQALRSQ